MAIVAKEAEEIEHAATACSSDDVAKVVICCKKRGSGLGLVVTQTLTSVLR